MKNHLSFFISMLMMMNFNSCKQSEQDSEFKYIADQFADLKILRYQIPDFDTLSLNQKKLVYFLSQAALCGRDIIFDQNGKYNLAIRKTLEAVVQSHKGETRSQEYQSFIIYVKRVWFSNGIYHHYANDKFIPGFSESFFRILVQQCDPTLLPLQAGQSVDDLLQIICPVMFDPSFLPKKVSQEPGKDLLTNSAVNFYEGVTEKEALSFYNTLKKSNDSRPPSYGINSKLVKERGKLTEKIWRADGMYGNAIKQIIGWMEKAATVAENEQQKQVIQTLISYYMTGDIKTFDEYNIKWLKDTVSVIDFVNGFIETYNDPLGMRANWESMVNFKDVKATKRTETIAANAQWFEDHSPVDPRFKKKEVKGVSAKVITVAQLGGDCYPSTPIGINLPNADWIRKEHGSKSVTLENITYAYDQASQGNGFLEEFCSSQAEVDLLKKYRYISGNLHTDLHECIGHASGQLLPGVSSDVLKNYGAVLEEARADLFALYYVMDPKIVELGLLPNLDAAKAEYIDQIRNGLFTQLVRIELGKDVEQAHMRNRQLISRWCYEKGKPENVIEQVTRNGKIYFRINDFAKLRNLFGALLKEIQRVKSEGDYEAGKNLVETYGIKIDKSLHKEVLERYAKLKLAPYSGFINPRLRPVEENGEIKDVKVEYPDNYMKQMLEYSKQYSFLPVWN
jgi:dipeptidyl-peptidase III